ncbi:unnamed protein product [Phaedon cochleariae]|uniref:C2H2-type domain-containing protein n=1 Tax=Phaedon cochleariae TaxID=80249 RepID=A0A9P0GX04_PHACE|nr:unnamed protein product [Phaedon cochleariae]
MLVFNSVFSRLLNSFVLKMSGEIQHTRVEDVFNFPERNESGNLKRIKLTVEEPKKTQLGCDICKISVTSPKILQRHLEGKRHKIRAERDGKIFRCELCNVTANSETQLSIHLNSKLF